MISGYWPMVTIRPAVRIHPLWRWITTFHNYRLLQTCPLEENHSCREIVLNVVDKTSLVQASRSLFVLSKTEMPPNPNILLLELGRFQTAWLKHRFVNALSVERNPEKKHYLPHSLFISFNDIHLPYNYLREI